MDPALLTAEQLLSLYATRQLSPVEALQAITERVARRNPALNAFVLLNPAALAAAGESEARWAAGRPLGLLDGVPCTVKDLIDVAGHPTRRGSRLTSAEPATTDAPAVMGLKAAGAVILGKTTTTEFGWKSPGDCPLNGITPQPMEHRAHDRRLVGGRRRRGGRLVRAAAHRHGCRRFRAHPGRLVRRGRAETDLRPHSAMAGRRLRKRRLRRPAHPQRA